MEISWHIDNNRILAFGLKYKKKLKFFHGNHEELFKLKEFLEGRTFFDSVKNFYQPVCLIGKGGSAMVIILLFKSIFRFTKSSMYSIIQKNMPSNAIAIFNYLKIRWM
jgi:hypothetical protein